MISRFSNRGGRGVLPTLLLLMMITAAPTWAAGGGEGGEYDAKAAFEAANTLIEEGRLDDAITALVDIAQSDPEQMERVQNLILEIRGIKSDVNELFAELNEAIVNGDEVLADAKIREIKEKDTDPNRHTLNNLILAAIVVSKAINDEIRDGYFARGNAFLAGGDYQAAVQAYREGFISSEYLEFYDDYIVLAQDEAEITRYLDDPERQEKIWEAYGSIGPEGDSIIQELQKTLDIWNTDALELPRITETALNAITAGGPEAWDAGTRTLISELEKLDVDYSDTQDYTSQLSDARRRLYTILDEVPEDFRYERIEQFLTGRSGREGTEGIFLAQRLLWESAYLEIDSQMGSTVERRLNQARSAYLSSDWDAATAGFDGAAAAAEAHQTYSIVAEVATADEADSGQSRLARAREEYGAYGSFILEASPLWLELTDMGRSIPDIDTLDFNVIDLARIDELADPIQNSVSLTIALQESWENNYTTLAALSGADLPLPKSLDTNIRADLKQASADFSDMRLRLYVNAVIPLYDNLEASSRGAMETDIAAARVRAVGTETEADVLPVRHPLDALDERIDPALAVLDSSQDAVGEFLNVLDEMLNRNPPIANPDEVIEYQRKAESLLLDVAAYRSSLDSLEREARALVAAARKAEISAYNALDAAERDLDSAQAAVARGRTRNDIDEFYGAIDLYNSVDSSLDRVDEFYLAMLVNDVDIAAASGIDLRRTGLRDVVLEDRSRLAVTVKNNAVEESRDAYDDGRYAYGIAILNQSQEFWNRAYSSDDPELDAWLTRLKNAQQALQQTVIEPNDPLYAEMNQYLNLANRHYAYGVRLAETDSRNSDALRAFRDSEDLIDQVLNTFPGNEAALLLQQRILRQTDEETWSKDAQTLIADTRRAVGLNDLDALRGNSREKGLYSQISVLRGIEPDFPGLDTLIYDVEVALGIVIPPPDPAVLARSRNLSSEARQIWDNIGLNGADRALELLDQALVLWLENEVASALKNEILLSSEPERLPSMPAELLNLIALFDRYYEESNFILAKALIDRAVSEYPAFSDDPRIRDRISKVEARL